jgi:uncharacterized protein (TIGR01777 family)
MRVVVAGGSGFVGRAVCRALVERGDEVVVLTRSAARARVALGPAVSLAEWSPDSPGPWQELLRGAGAVVNLAGEPIAQRRWTEARKAVLRSSRIDVTRALVHAIAAADPRPEVLVSTSAVGFYGPRSEGDVTEEDGAGADFLARLCLEWEQAAREAEAHGVRVALLRLGVVLGEQGGALARLLPPFRMFVGGPVGGGGQAFPWVHVEDVVAVILLALGDPRFSGPFNVTGPQPLTMRAFCEVLGRVLGRPSWLPVPAFVVRALFGEAATVLLSGQRAVPARLEALGYRFRFPTAEAALRDLLRS